MDANDLQRDQLGKKQQHALDGRAAARCDARQPQRSGRGINAADFNSTVELISLDQKPTIHKPNTTRARGDYPPGAFDDFQAFTLSLY